MEWVLVFTMLQPSVEVGDYVTTMEASFEEYKACDGMVDRMESGEFPEVIIVYECFERESNGQATDF